jgi:hypothetical protein
MVSPELGGMRVFVMMSVPVPLAVATAADVRAAYTLSNGLT